MKTNKKRITLLNTISSLLLQLFTIISGFVIPKIILSTFGSETNGLVSSLNQFLNYIAILEGGLNSVVMASLYRPIVKKEAKKISAIINASKKFFRKIAFILIIYSLVIALTYPLFTKSTFSYGFIFSLTLILTFKLFTQYCFSFSYKNLLNAGKYGYVINFTQIAIIVLDITSAFIVVSFFPSIHVLKIISAIIFLLQPIIFTKACSQFFKLDKEAKEDQALIKNRWDGLSINIAAFIHNNTDITILTIFKGLQTVSVYGIYNLVVAGLRGLIQSVTSGIAPSIGTLYAGNDKITLNKRFDEFEYITFMMVFFAFSMAVLLITPFVMIYTSNITDADYYQPVFGILILLAEFAYMLREPYVKMAYMAGKFKEQNKHAYIEAFLNIIISLSLVRKFGLVGIAIGTLIAMIYRTIFQILFLRNNVLYRSFVKFLKRFCVFFIPSVIAVIMCYIYIPINEYTIHAWILYAAIYALIFLTLDILISVIFFKKELTGILKYIRR